MSQPVSDQDLHSGLETLRGHILAKLLDAAPLGAILNRIVYGVEALAPGAKCSILLVTPDGKSLTLGAAPSLPDFYNAAVEGLPVAIGEGCCGTAAATGARVEAPDIATDPYWEKYLAITQKAGLVACWSEPIFDSKQKVIGTFAIYHGTVRAADDQSKLIIHHASALTALAIERDRTNRELELHRNHLEQLVADRAATILDLNRKLEHRAAEADAANKAKTRFLANMSHEIRTPLNAILGLSWLVRDDAADPLLINRVDKILAAGQHLLGTIDTILDLTKIDAGKLVLDNTAVDPVAILNRVLLMMRDPAEGKGLRLSAEIGALPSGRLAGDAIRLQQALLNYVSNAVKFTVQGEIILRVFCTAQDDTSATLRFEVVDTGIGLDQAELQRVFSEFEQADSSTTRRFGGTGLGLPITRRFAELMGGAAGASSEPGVGSVFWFTAKLALCQGDGANPDTPPPEPREVLRQRWAGARVLLAEDDMINAEIAISFLRAISMNVDHAANGRRAVDMATATAYDLILMDMQMPEMDGIEATIKILSQPDRAKTPIIAMTANAFSDDRDQCLRAGMRGFIAKPVVPRRLYQAVLDVLQGERRD